MQVWVNAGGTTNGNQWSSSVDLSHYPYVCIICILVGYIEARQIESAQVE